MKKKKIVRSNLLILGSGPSGYTAAIYAARSNLNPILVTGPTPGGQLITTNTIENWPGDYKNITGIQLMDRMNKHSKKLKTKIVFDIIKKVNFMHKPFFLFGEENIYISNSVIIATGSYAKYLGLKSEKEYMGKGVSSCATCDGIFYKNKDIAIVGGGNTAIEEVLYLSNIVSKIHLIHRKENFKAEKILINRLKKKIESKKVIFHKNSIVYEIFGKENCVSGIKIKNHKNIYSEIKISGLFIAIGHIPNTKIFSNQLKTKKGYISVQKILIKNSTQTNIPGIFAAGDVIDNCYKQAITAAATGCMAALDAKEYLEKENK
ncbi:Thioredoxin reductase [Buchnera aphidicola (Tetraneura ulmi)]|uniref:thioredoxin-disulfide reductase n=1 Tax=Buchnera aphidicola TaxID=9 RepID=UPI003464B6AD